MKNLICILVCGVLVFPLACSDDDKTNPVDGGSQAVTWELTYGGENFQFGNDMIQASSGNFLVTGYTWWGSGVNRGDVLLLEVNASGEILWSRTYNLGQTDMGYSVVEVGDGGYAVAGYASSGEWYVSDAFLLRVDSSGDSLWARKFGGSSGATANSAIATTDGGFLLAGQSLSSDQTSYRDVYVIKTDAYGIMEWELATCGTGDESGDDVVETDDGGYLVSGSTDSCGNGSWNVYLVKVSGDGDTVWTRTYGDSESAHGLSIDKTEDGGAVMAGYTDPFGAELSSAFLIKVNGAGDSLWARTFGGSESDGGTDVKQCADGGYVLTGYSGSSQLSNLVLMRTSAEGNLLWSRGFSVGQIATGASVAQTSDGGFVAAGTTRPDESIWDEVYIIMTDAEGRVAK